MVLLVVYYHVPTSNHNCACISKSFLLLYIIMFLHQTTTLGVLCTCSVCCILSCSYIKPQHFINPIYIKACCILSCSYIKPQLSNEQAHQLVVVYYHVPTSNHNLQVSLPLSVPLYIIMFLHQTTTYSIEVIENQ